MSTPTPPATTTTTAWTSLLVACLSLGVVYACVHGAGGDVDSQTRTGAGEDDGEEKAGSTASVDVDVGKGQSKGKGRKKKGKGKGEPAVIIPGDFDTIHPVSRTRTDTSGDVEAPTSQHSNALKKNRNKDKAKKEQGKGAASASPSLSVPVSVVRTATHSPQPSSSQDTDSSWTHVDDRRFKTNSTDGQTRGVDATSSDLELDSPWAQGVPERHAQKHDSITTDMRGPRAELASAPHARTGSVGVVDGSAPGGTGIDAMLERPVVPRVIRVQPRAEDTPVPGFSWEDYGDVVVQDRDDSLVDESDQGEWDVVQSRRRQHTRPTQTTTGSVSTSTPHAPPPPASNMTQKQRQNARKREMAKSLKAETEAARLEGLAKHKRELERLWMTESGHKGKGASGGMHAVVDDRGKLVWE